ncbi:uncharacterized protein LOC117179073 [Belonocnema kinseyi]|uniref:uncharacterized protein LOC117179073 n=1 Tax=Belonocnema kinseyi TaxID=2817044 RepID=UPI00143D5AE1|nr:uncharacterized protein LOC117179073 [Belonocnema kinseyi]
MEDGTHFEGKISKTASVPYWMQPRGNSRKSVQYNVFIMKSEEAFFISKLKCIEPIVTSPSASPPAVSLSLSLSINHNQHNQTVKHDLRYGPRYAEIRLGDQHYSAMKFGIHQKLRINPEGRDLGVFPSVMHVYISFPTIDEVIYTTKLIPHVTGHRLINHGGMLKL